MGFGGKDAEKKPLKVSFSATFSPVGPFLSILACRCGGPRNRMRERPQPIGHGVPSPLDMAIKATDTPPISPRNPLRRLYLSLTNGSLLTALLAGPGFGRPYSLAPVPPPGSFNPCVFHLGLTHTHGRSLMLSFDHPSLHCRVGGLLLTVTSMACLNLPVSAHLPTRFH